MRSIQTNLSALKPLATEEVAHLGVHVQIETLPKERADLARDLGLEDLSSFDAEVQLEPVQKNERKIDGHLSLSANLVQKCVVSLEPVADRLSRRFELILHLSSLDQADDSADEDLEEGSTRIIEELKGEQLDLKPILIEALALSLNPYPRIATAEPDVPNSAYISFQRDEGAAQEQASHETENKPFSNLKDLLASKH